MSRRKRKKNPKTLERSRRNARKAAQRFVAQFNQPDGRNCVARVSNAAVARPMGVSVALAGTLGTGALEAIPGPHAFSDEQIRRNREANAAAREQHMRELRSDIERDRWENCRARDAAKRLQRAAAPPPPAPLEHPQARRTRRRTKAKRPEPARADVLLDPPPAPDQQPPRPAPTGLARHRFPMTGVEAAAHTVCNPLQYRGFVTESRRAVCAKCLDSKGAQRVLRGSTFYRWIWRPADLPTAETATYECSDCGAAFEGESIP